MNKNAKRLFLLSSIAFSVGIHPLFCQSSFEIDGIVKDKNNEPLTGVNVFLQGSIDGGFTDSDGKFQFTTMQKDTVVLMVSYLGFKDYKIRSDVSKLNHLTVRLESKEMAIDEVVIVASSFNFGADAGKLKKMNSLDIVMTGSSNGDIYAALQSLPGTQKVGENGRLYVRGGESNETQTFINGMHVLAPYTTNAENSVQRSRFSPFLFKGINLVLGGYAAEYGQALSSVLPMQTTDVSTEDKLGISFSPFNLNMGGTIAQKKSSFSFNGDYMNMFLYNKVFPDSYNWINPYQKTSGETQYKVEFNPNNILKMYAEYDYTTFKQNVNDYFDPSLGRKLYFKEHNLYLNSTFKSYLPNGYSLFLGAANSTINDRIDNSVITNDRYENNRNELHLKASIDKAVSSRYRLSLGGEAYLRSSAKAYRLSSDNLQYSYNLGYNIMSLHLDNNVRIYKGLYFNFSGRMEYETNNNGWIFLPRTSLSYVLSNHLQFSAVYGSYSQAAEDDILASNRRNLQQAYSDHFILSMAYNKPAFVCRIEPYYKKYSKLPLLNQAVYSSTGHGYSRGIDFFLEDKSCIKNLQSTIAYSYNDSKRLYLDYTQLSQPQYATTHNFNVSFRYYLPSIKTYLGVSNLFASGRPYHDPNKPGFMNAKTSPYNSLDLNMTFLLKPNVILYTSMTNLLGRKNIFNYKFLSNSEENNEYSKIPVVASRGQFFYIGIFISLMNTKAYEVSNF